MNSTMAAACEMALRFLRVPCERLLAQATLKCVITVALRVPLDDANHVDVLALNASALLQFVGLLGLTKPRFVSVHRMHVMCFMQATLHASTLSTAIGASLNENTFSSTLKSSAWAITSFHTPCISAFTIVRARELTMEIEEIKSDCNKT